MAEEWFVSSLGETGFEELRDGEEWIVALQVVPFG